MLQALSLFPGIREKWRWDEAVDCFTLEMKGFVDCLQIRRLKTEGNYWDDAACGIRARAASRLWRRRMRGVVDGGGCRMLAALCYGKMLLAATSSVSEDALEAGVLPRQLSRMPERVCAA